MSHLAIKLTDTAICKAVSNKSATELVGIGTPFVLRPHKSRLSATWYLVTYKGNTRHRYKLGTWPNIKANRIAKAESDLLISAATNSKVAIDEWVYVS
ncbi:hypothetical protein ACPV5G_20740, partial [Photobacterium damselae]|uniref:hypothetical protein n=1 Tax=Photobacterium damselae TaxID=38293 RepID=UPI0040686249